MHKLYVGYWNSWTGEDAVLRTSIVNSLEEGKERVEHDRIGLNFRNAVFLVVSIDTPDAVGFEAIRSKLIAKCIDSVSGYFMTINDLDTGSAVFKVRAAEISYAIHKVVLNISARYPIGSKLN